MRYLWNCPIGMKIELLHKEIDIFEKSFMTKVRNKGYMDKMQCFIFSLIKNAAGDKINSKKSVVLR